MTGTTIEIVATSLFGAAIIHTFSVKRFQHLAHKYPTGSIGENLFHLLGEVEIVFGIWAAALIVSMLALSGAHEAIHYLESLNFTEPAFVFVIMTMAATRPVIELAQGVIALVARIFPLGQSLSFYVTALVMGPLLGSFITEPAAMTVTALILKQRYFDANVSKRFKYITLAVLFVNVSIGGVLTNFAAPPVLMVAGIWKWDMAYMLFHFGWKAIIAVSLNTLFATLLVLRDLRGLVQPVPPAEAMRVPWGLTLIHLAFLALVVATSHHSTVFLGLFLFFLGMAKITEEYQHEIKLKEGLLVGFFLGGLVVLGTLQRWWLQPVLASLSNVSLFAGATILTGFVDNAALTYLGAQVPGISELTKYALVAGAVTGGGLTVIANAPNPAGFAILRGSFGDEGISPIGLFLNATIPTLIAAACFWFLP